jgi:hypothetical protein
MARSNVRSFSRRIVRRPTSETYSPRAVSSERVRFPTTRRPPSSTSTSRCGGASRTKTTRFRPIPGTPTKRSSVVTSVSPVSPSPPPARSGKVTITTTGAANSRSDIARYNSAGRRRAHHSASNWDGRTRVTSFVILRHAFVSLHYIVDAVRVGPDIGSCPEDDDPAFAPRSSGRKIPIIRSSRLAGYAVDGYRPKEYPVND